MMEALIIKRLWLLLCLFGFMAIGEPPKERRKRLAAKKRRRTMPKRQIKSAPKKPKSKKPKQYKAPKLTEYQERKLTEYYMRRDGFYGVNFGGKIPL